MVAIQKMLKNSQKKRGNKKTRKNRCVSIMQKFEQDVVIVFLEMLNTIKLYHWKTFSYATHKATDELYAKMNEHVDKFVEVLLGKTGSRVNLTQIKQIRLKDFTSVEQMKREMDDFKGFLVSLDNQHALKLMSNADLYTIRDEILADVNQFLYLLTFTK